MDARILERLKRLKRRARELRADQVSLRAVRESPAATTLDRPERTIHRRALELGGWPSSGPSKPELNSDVKGREQTQ